MRDLAEPYRYTVAISHHQFAVLLGQRKLVIGLYLPAALRIFHRPFRRIDVAGGDGLAHLLQAQSHVVDLIQVQVDTHRGQGAAAHVDLADAVQLRNLLRQYGRCRIVKLAARQALAKSATGS